MSSRVTEAILIHRDGTFLGRYPLITSAGGDWAAHARALLDMVNTVNASFGPDPGDLQEVTFGEVTLRLDRSTHLVLASVVQGRVRPALVRRLRGLLEDLEVNYHGALADWTGRSADLVGLDAFLRRLVAGT